MDLEADRPEFFLSVYRGGAVGLWQRGVRPSWCWVSGLSPCGSRVEPATPHGTPACVLYEVPSSCRVTCLGAALSDQMAAPPHGRRSGGTVGRAEGEEKHRERLEAGSGGLKTAGGGPWVRSRAARGHQGAAEPRPGASAPPEAGMGLSQGCTRHLQRARGLCSSACSLLFSH